MSAERAAESPWGGVELLERAIGYTRGALVIVTPELMSAPTPCAGWDLGALLAHMVDSLTSLHEAGSVRRVAVRVDFRVAPSGPDDLVATLRTRACQLLADWAADGFAPPPATAGPANVLVGGRAITPRVLTSAGALEVAVHGWDVAAACGVRRPLPTALAEDLLRVASALVTEADRPGRFGPAVEVDPAATADERLLAFLGRRGG